MFKLKDNDLRGAKISKVNKYSLHLIFFVFLTYLCSTISYKVDAPLIRDEGYHIDNSVVQGELRSINPLAHDYGFFGHPPLYRITAVVWFKVFPNQSEYARYHALTFTFCMIFLLYLLLNTLVSWPLACLGATFLFYTYYVQTLGTSITANIPEICLFLFCLYLTTIRKFKTLSFSFLSLVMMRESGIAFAIGLISSNLISRKPLSDWKKTVLTLLPGILSLLAFFGLIYYTFNHLSIHPYATGKLEHLDPKHRFLSITDQKVQNFKFILNYLKYCFFINPIIICGFFSTLFFLLKFFKKIESRSEELILQTFFLCLSYFVFLFFYGDFADRDAGVIIVSIIIITTLLVHEVTKYIFKYPIFIIMLLLTFTLSNNVKTDHTYAERLYYKKIALKIQEKFKGKIVCLPQPISSRSDKIHGLFYHPLTFTPSYTYNRDCDVLSIYSTMSNEHRSAVEYLLDGTDISKPSLESVHRNDSFQMYDISKIEINKVKDQ